MKVNSQRMASPAAGGVAQAPGLQRSASAKQASTPSPFGAGACRSQYQYLQPARASTSTPDAPSYPRLESINCKVATSADTPPATPKSASSYYSSMFSPRKLMQRAARAFRGGRSSRRKKSALAAADAGDVAADSPRSAATSKGSDAESVFSLDDQIADDAVRAGAAAGQEEEVVPEKIIHEANPSSTVIHKLAPVAEEQDEVRNTTPEKEDAAAEKEKEKDEEPKKEAPRAPEDTVAEVDEIAVAKKQQREEAIKAEVVRRFQGSRVRERTSMEKNDETTPRRRDNEAIEEARTKLLALRQGSKVKALVGAFETVMDDSHSCAAAIKPRLNLRV